MSIVFCSKTGNNASKAGRQSQPSRRGCRGPKVGGLFRLINLKTAKALGLEVPATLLARTDEVIERSWRDQPVQDPMQA